MNELSNTNCEIVPLTLTALLEVIGDKMLNDKSNHRMLTATIYYIKNTQRFEKNLSE